MESIVIIVAHPDDVAAAISGTLLLLKDKYKLHILCATKGERGIPGETMEKTAAIREQEEKAACELLGAELTFLNRINREFFADKETSQLVADILLKIKPRAVFTLWAIDSHPDHSAVSELTRKALFLSGIECELYYFPGGLQCQTLQFDPDLYVDISSVIEKKIKIIRCHKCQNINDKMLEFFIEQGRISGIPARVEQVEVFKSGKKLTVNKATVFSAFCNVAN